MAAKHGKTIRISARRVNSTRSALSYRQGTLGTDALDASLVNISDAQLAGLYTYIKAIHDGVNTTDVETAINIYL